MTEYNIKSKFESIISVQSRQSNNSVPRSLGRPSFELGDINLENKASLVYAMSIESQNRKSDIFERLLESQKKSSYRPSSIINSQYNQELPNKYQQHNIQRNSLNAASNQIEIDHQCKCFENCYQTECSCFLAKNQICVKGTCCTKCVELKNFSMKNNSLSLPNGSFYLYVNQNNQNQIYPTYQQSIQISQNLDSFTCNCKNTQCLKSYCKCFQNGQFCSEKCGCQYCKNKQHTSQREAALQAIKTYGLTYCTCKKTKCNKKYCSCYAQGVKCGKNCSCQNCTNCERTNQMDIQVYSGEEEEDFKNAQMPERMSFEPVVFE